MNNKHLVVSEDQHSFQHYNTEVDRNKDLQTEGKIEIQTDYYETNDERIPSCKLRTEIKEESTNKKDTTNFKSFINNNLLQDNIFPKTKSRLRPNFGVKTANLEQYISKLAKHKLNKEMKTSTTDNRPKDFHEQFYMNENSINNNNDVIDVKASYLECDPYTHIDEQSGEGSSNDILNEGSPPTSLINENINSPSRLLTIKPDYLFDYEGRETTIRSNEDPLKQALENHLQKSFSHKLFQCSVCEYNSHSSNSLELHMRRHNESRQHQCQKCHYRGRTAANLKQHLLTHTNLNPFACTICDYRSKQIGNLKRHMLTHTDEKPFQCTYCEYRSRQSGDLSRHLRTHTKEKPFKCLVCEYRCRTSGNLGNHMRTHTNEKPYDCKICGYKFSQAGNLKKHIKIKH